MIGYLPDHLLKYQAIFWDVENESLLYVPQTAFNESVPFASFKRTKQGHWLLRGLGSKGVTTFRDTKKYLPLAGKL